MRTCPSCSTPGLPEGARFCFNCAAPLRAPGCPACGFDVPPQAKFCPECAAPQPGAPAAAPQSIVQPVASRRITSVLFGDLVGFTALSESRDQEDVRELLSGYFESCSQVIARYGGTVEKFIGDAVMAVWGVPTAHEDDAERAVRAGLELVNLITALGADLGVPDLAMRVGIVTGEVAVTVGATQQGMVAGDAVNTAARVQTAALPGQVWVDETTRLLTSSSVTYADVGSHVMKGKADAMPLWSVRAIVAGMGGSQRADGLEAPHIGRDRETRLVKELFHGVEETRRPTLLVVSGDAGVGKSRLGWEFEKYVDGLTRSTWWHQGRCLSYGEGVAFYALAEAIRARLQNLHPDPEASFDETPDPGQLLELGLAQLALDPDERAWLQPRLGALLGVSTVGTYKREDLFAAWTTFLQRLSDDGNPVVLVIEDAHHADDGLLSFVEHLLAVGSFPCFVVLLARPSLLEGRPTLATNRRATVLNLETLTDRGMSQLLDALVVGLPEAARSALVARAEGIPLYAVETVRSLIDRDLVVPRGGQYVLADPDRLDLSTVNAPASLQALIAARLDTLPSELRRVIDRASVLGDSFTYDAIAALSPDLGDLDAALAGLVRLQLLRRESSRFTTEAGQFQFVQTAVRQVAYGTLARRDRKASHLAVVRQLESLEDPGDELAPIIAQHYLAAVDAVPDETDAEDLAAAAVTHLQRAASRASALGVPAEAAGHLRTALSRTTDPEARPGIELELARELSRTGDHEGAMAHATSCRDAFDARGDAVAAGDAVAVMTRVLASFAHDYETSIALAEERLKALRGRDDASSVVLALLKNLIGARLDTGADFGSLCEEQQVLAERGEDEFEIADAFISYALHYDRAGARHLSRTLLQAAADIAQRLHDPRMRTMALVNISAMWVGSDVDTAADSGREAVREAHGLGELTWSSVAAINLFNSLLLQGSWTEAEELSRSDARQDLDEVYWTLGDSYISLTKGEVLAADPETAGPVQAPTRVAFAHLHRAVALVSTNDPAAAQITLDALRQMEALVGLSDDFVLAYVVALDVLTRLDDRAGLRALDELVDAHHPGTHSRGVRALRSHRRAVVAMQEGVDPATVEGHLRSALTDARAWHAGTVVARISADLGVWLTQQGRSDEAAEPLETARTQFAAMGATSWLADLEDRLSGVRA